MSLKSVTIILCCLICGNSVWKEIVEDFYLPTAHLPLSLHTKFHGLNKDATASDLNNINTPDAYKLLSLGF